jgi:hypothetical protein
MILMLMSGACALASLVGLVVVLASLLPDYKSRQPPTKITNVIFRPDLLTPIGRRWRFVVMFGWLLAVVFCAIGFLGEYLSGNVK